MSHPSLHPHAPCFPHVPRTWAPTAPYTCPTPPTLLHTIFATAPHAPCHTRTHTGRLRRRRGRPAAGSRRRRRHRAHHPRGGADGGAGSAAARRRQRQCRGGGGRRGAAAPAGVYMCVYMSVVVRGYSITKELRPKTSLQSWVGWVRAGRDGCGRLGLPPAPRHVCILKARPFCTGRLSVVTAAQPLDGRAPHPTPLTATAAAAAAAAAGVGSGARALDRDRPPHRRTGLAARRRRAAAGRLRTAAAGASRGRQPGGAAGLLRRRRRRRRHR